MSYNTNIMESSPYLRDQYNYWFGPYCVMIRSRINCVPAKDGRNLIYKNGEQTKLECQEPNLSESEYKKRYAISMNGFYYYKERNSYVSKVNEKNDYWIGPYGIRVPNTIYFVVSKDGHGILNKSGGETKVNSLEPDLTEMEYKEKFSKRGKDGFYYYKEKKFTEDIEKTSNDEPSNLKKIFTSDVEKISKFEWDEEPSNFKKNSVHPPMIENPYEYIKYSDDPDDNETIRELMKTHYDKIHKKNSHRNIRDERLSRRGYDFFLEKNEK